MLGPRNGPSTRLRIGRTWSILQRLSWTVVPLDPRAKRSRLGPPLLEEFDDLGWQRRWLSRGEDAVELLLQLLRRWATEDSHMPRAIQE